MAPPRQAASILTAVGGATRPRPRSRPPTRPRPRPRPTPITAAAASSSSSGPPSLEARLGAAAGAAAAFFPVYLAAGAALALLHPPAFTWFTPAVTPALALTMGLMGTTLRAADLEAIAAAPARVAQGALLQYSLMPLAGFCVSRAAGLPPAAAAGLLMVAACPGGVASNVVAFIARADVPLSVAMTTVSTLLAPILTPALAKLLAGATVPLDAGALVASTASVVLAPLAAGAALAAACPGLVARLAPFAPLAAVTATCLVCGAILGTSAPSLAGVGARTVAAVAALHTLGFGAGYVGARVLGMPETAARTASIETGMQNSALAAVLAAQAWPGLAGAGAPGAISACVHSLIGSALAGWWRARPPPVVMVGKQGA
jgi:bile acid:Na+ symporter, BASS family